MHPYGIQQRIKQWGKDQVVYVGQRATLYKMITRLDAAGLIAVHDTVRNDRYPERTTYRITDRGRSVAREWLTEILSTPRNEFPEFPAALSYLAMLTPQAARELLDQRRKRLIQWLDEIDAQLSAPVEGLSLPRVTQLETEYVRAVTEAELRWVSAILVDLDDGSLTWDREQLDAIAGGMDHD